jgi:hypothetical protein
MKATNMASETAAAGLLMKLGAALGLGIVGAAVIAALDPPKTRKEMFLHAGVAGVGSLVFGPVAVRLLDHFADFVDLNSVGTAQYLEWAMPVYFVVGALSWGGAATLVKLRTLIADKGASVVGGRIGL